MKLGNHKWTSSVQSTSSEAIIDVAKQVLSDMESTAVIVQKNQHLEEFEINRLKALL